MADRGRGRLALVPPPLSSGMTTHLTRDDLRKTDQMDRANLLMFTHEQFDAALRQRADEAREECVRIVYDEAHYEEETAKRIVAAIRARITPKGEP
jgi:replicative superfamily II helicase